MRIYISLFFLLFTKQVAASNLIESLTGVNLNENKLFQQLDLSVGGWFSMGGGYASNNADNHNNFPLTFNDRHGEFQLSQLNIFLQSPVNTESVHWDFGGQIDFMFGTDARFTQSSGLDDELLSESNLSIYDIALPQAYLEIYAPWANGITLKLGHFYTIIGYEVVTAPDNFFYSHAYTMQYAEPFTHTGALFQYPYNNNLSFSFGTVMGWDNSEDDAGSWSFLGGISWLNDEADTSVALSLVSGNVSDSEDNNRTVSSLVVTQYFTDNFSYVFQHDFGFQQNSDINGNDGYWFGINQYLFYDFNETVSLGLRAEWFRDADDTRLAVGKPSSFYGISAGLNWSPIEWATFRPEVRYDWADSDVDVYDNQTEDSLLTFSLDLVINL